MKKSMKVLIFTTLLMCQFTVAQWTTEWQYQTNEDSPTGITFVGFANMDDDPQKEIVYRRYASSTSSYIKIIDGSTGTLEYTYSIPRSWMPLLDDIDDDGKDELIVFTKEDNSSYTDYRITVIGYSGGTYVENENNLPVNPSVDQNYPNPFNPNTTINYSVSTMEKVELEVFNIAGKSIATIVNDIKTPGKYSISWNGTDRYGNKVSSGTYFYQLKVGDTVQSKKMILIK